MAIKTINIGTNANDGTGDDLRAAFEKVNDNFAELLAVGGETNTASNKGVGTGVFHSKVGVDLQFRTLRNQDGKIAITNDDNSIYLDTTGLADNDFGVVQVDNGDQITASTSGAVLGIKSGNTNITTTRNGNDVIITGAFEVVNDPTPQLAGNLSMLSSNITGPGNITAITSIDTTALDTDTLLVNTTSTFTGNMTANGSITANAGVIVPSGQTISGNLNGGFQGTITGAIDTNEQTIKGDGNIIIDTAQINIAGTLGTQLGVTYRSQERPLIVQSGPDLPAEFITISTNTTVPAFPVTIESVVDKSLTGGQTYQPGFGAILNFTANDTDNTLLPLGGIGGRIVDGTVNEIVLLPVQNGRPVNEQQSFFAFNSSGIATLNEVQIGEGNITTNVSNKNLTLSANGSGKVDFYGAYQFPSTIGNAGEVLKVPTSGTLLEWGAGGGGGGGSSTFVGLTDTPSSYAGSAADAGKFLRVASSGSAVEFVTLTSVVDSAFINTAGGLLKAGGTMAGNIDLGTNNITNGGTITATNVNGTTITATNINGTFTGDLKGSIVSDDSTPIIDGQNRTGTFTTLNASTVTANLTGNATGSHVGTLDGDVTGSVFGDDSTLLVDGVANKVLLTNNTTTELTEGTNLYYTDSRVDARVTQSFVNALGITATSTVGTVDGDLTGSVFADDSSLIVDGVNNVITTTKITATDTVSTKADIGNIHIEGTQLDVPSNSNFTITAQGTGHIHLDGDVRIDGVLSQIGNQAVSISGTATPSTLSTDSYASFITTQSWVSVGADLAYANLGAGKEDGQRKLIKMVNRGTYSTNGGATNPDRYLVVNLTINGAVSTLNVSQNSEYGAVTLIWYNNSWWIESKFDS